MTRLIIQGIFLVMTVAIMDVKATPLSFLNSRGGGEDRNSGYGAKDDFLKEFIINERALRPRQQQHLHHGSGSDARNYNLIPRARFLQGNNFFDNDEEPIKGNGGQFVSEVDDDFGGVWHLPIKTNEERMMN